MKIFFACLLVLFLASATFAYPPGWGDDIRLTFNSAFSSSASLAIDSNNNVHIAWYDRRDEYSEIYYTKLDNNGNTLVDDRRLTFDPANSYNPSLAIDSNNNVHIAWHDYRDGDYCEIYYTKLDNNGNTLVDDTRLTFSPDYSTYPSLAIDSNNNVHIAWYDRRDVYYTKLDNNGNTLVEDTRLTFADATYYRPALSTDSNNNVHIAWGDYRDGDYCEIYYTKLDNNGNTLVDDTRLTFDPVDSRLSSLAIDSNNNVHIVWDDFRDGDNEIYYTKLDNNGNTLVDDRRLTFDPGGSELPSLALDSHNNVQIAWRDYRGGDYSEIYYTKLDNNGNTLVDDRRLTFNLSSMELLSLALDSHNNVHIVWDDWTNHEIYYKRSYDIQKYEILAIPLNWQGTQQEFANAVNTQINFFLNEVPLDECREQVNIRILDVSKYNLDFFCAQNDCNVGAIKDYASQLKDIGDLETCDVILGLAETSPCPPIAGCSNGVDTIWVTKTYDTVAAHEIGHLFGLEDEYCSNPAGSLDSRCNDGGPLYNGNDINYLDALLSCDPRDGLGCCGASAGFLSCSDIDYGVCCYGNVNDLGGRDIMSYADAPPPRAFDDHSKAHLVSQPKLNCESALLRNAEIGDIIDVRLLVYQDGAVIDNGIILVQGEPSEYHDTGGNYFLSVLDNQGAVLFNQQFNLYFDYTGPVVLGEDYSGINYTFVDLSYKIPYSENMYELRLYRGEDILFSKILNFCDLDYICESGETYLTCPQDCPLDQPDGICFSATDGICDPDCAKGIDIDCGPTLEHINDIIVREGQAVVITAHATDPNDEELFYSIDDPRFQQNNNVFTWQTHIGDRGFYEVTVSVTDGYLEDSQVVGITVNRYIPPKPPLPYELYHDEGGY